ncbi:MAG: phenylacetate-CoA ligase [Firmicutes bacterium]|nr:phenylacetate-CoA ligase [Bacillota bacterium]
MMTGLPITPLDDWTAEKIGVKNNWVTREQIADYQLAKLKETVERAQASSPFYRSHLAGYRANSLNGFEEFSSYPFTTSADITRNAMRMLCVSQSNISRVVTLTTSGTTGQPKRLYFTPDDQELTIDFFRCGMSTFAGPGDRTLILLPGERTGSVGDLLAEALNRIGVKSVSYGLVEQAPNAVHSMCQEKATCIVGVPAQVLAMARYWESWGKSNWTPRCVLLSTDHVPTAIVDELERIWKCEVFNHYGMTEMGLGGGLECAAHDGCHLREADLYFEIIDPASGQPLPEGEYGEVVFTTLTRRGMPLIRYRTGDISRFIAGTCSCGSKVRRLERIRSRLNGEIRFTQESGFTLADLDEILFALPEVINFSVEIRTGATTVLKITAAVLPEVVFFDKRVILRALRQVPAIQAAEEAGALLLEVEILREWFFSPGKRVVRIVESAKEAGDGGNA